MKKIFAVLIMFVMVLTGCSKAGYYYPQPYASKIVDEKETEEINEEKNIPLEGEELSICQEIYNNVSKYYGIEKPEPKFCVMETNRNMGSMKVDAHFSEEDQIVYVKKEAIFTENGKATIAHEILHYFGDLTYEEQGYTFGIHLNEGVTNYLSTQVYPFPKDYSVYEYETHCAAMIANAFGEEELRSCFFQRNVEKLRNDFNETMKDEYPSEKLLETDIKITAFDVFAGNLETYFYNLASLGTTRHYWEQRGLVSKLLNSCEEELLIYNEKKGMDAKVLTQNLLENSSRDLPFGEITAFATMIR